MYGFAARAVQDFRRWTDLSLPDAAGSEVSRRHAAHRRRRRVLADDAEAERPSDHHAISCAIFVSAEAADDATVVVRFAEKRARDVPLFVAGMPIFSRAYYSKRPFDESTLDIPLGSGAYKVGRFRSRAATSNSNASRTGGARICRFRSDRTISTSLRFEYYRDRDVGFEGFTAKSYLFREEFTSRIWATRYDFPAIRDGRVKRDELPDDTPSGAQGWFINTRRKKFENPQLREALNYAFDFEWTNKNIMYGSYQRTHSVFQNSDMMAQGKPGADELALLEPLSRQGAGRSVRRAIRAAGFRRLGPGSRSAAQGHRNSCRMPASSSRMASACCRTANRSRSNF